MKPWRRLIVVAVLLAWTAPASGQRVRLTHKFTPGDTTVYHHIGLLRGTVFVPDGQGGATPFPVHFRITTDIEECVLDVTPQGVASLRYLIPRATATLRWIRDEVTHEHTLDLITGRLTVDGKEVGGEPSRFASDLSVFLRHPFHTRVDPRGRVLWTDLPMGEVKQIVRQVAPSINLSVVSNAAPGLGIVFPENPVAVGDSWTHTRTLGRLPRRGLSIAPTFRVFRLLSRPRPQPQPLKETMTYTLRSVRPDARGRRIAAIEMRSVIDGHKHTFALIRWSVDEGKLVWMGTTSGGELPVRLKAPGARDPVQYEVLFHTRTSTVRVQR